MHRAAPVRPAPLSLLSRLSLPDGLTELTITAELLHDLVLDRAEGTEEQPVFDEMPAAVGLDYFPSPLPRHPLNLRPLVPVFIVDQSYDFASGDMERFVQSHPISIVRGLAERLQIDLSLYSIDKLASLHPTMPLKVNIQRKNERDSNKDDNGNHSWELISERGRGTLQAHHKYMQKALEEEGKSVAKKSKKDEEKVRFGVGHLSEYPLQFADQLKELDKLPEIFRPGKPTDLLSLMGFYFPGLSGVYTFLKVEGVRTQAHEEDGGIPSVNVAIGPGTSQWMAVEVGYIKTVEDECSKKGLEYGRSSIWPDKQELEALNVPVYQFSQKPGDLVFTGPATLHWVQGESVGANIAWNAGSLSTQALKYSKWEYERNRSNKMHSSIPMERTVWRIAERETITDANVLFDLRGMLTRSLAYLFMLEKWMEDSKVGVTDMAANLIDERFVCDHCQTELFNLVFAGPGNSNHCFSCMEQHGGIQSHVPRRQRPIADLAAIYDRFKQ